jgi:hypothetical protein
MLIYNARQVRNAKTQIEAARARGQDQYANELQAKLDRARANAKLLKKVQ